MRRPDDLFELFPDLPRLGRHPLAARLGSVREKARQSRARAQANARRQRAAAIAVRDEMARRRRR